MAASLNLNFKAKDLLLSEPLIDVLTKLSTVSLSSNGHDRNTGNSDGGDSPTLINLSKQLIEQGNLL
jgi:hypothetical protein